MDKLKEMNSEDLEAFRRVYKRALLTGEPKFVPLFCGQLITALESQLTASQARERKLREACVTAEYAIDLYVRMAAEKNPDTGHRRIVEELSGAQTKLTDALKEGE